MSVSLYPQGRSGTSFSDGLRSRFGVKRKEVEVVGLGETGHGKHCTIYTETFIYVSVTVSH